MSQGTIRVVQCVSRKLRFRYYHYFECGPMPEIIAPGDEKSVFPVDSLDIEIDLMLAIEHPSVESVLQMPGFPNNFENLLRLHNCHVIPKSCHKDHMAAKHCYFITFSCLERELIKNMDLHHKKCYKVLKSLISSEITISPKCMNLSSYTLKTAFLFHVYGETKCLHSGTLSACIQDVLNYLSSCLYHIKMPCFFARDMNTWGHFLETPNWYWTKVEEPSSEASKLFWIKLMYKYVNYLKRLIFMETPLSDEELKNTIRDKCDYFKAAVGQIIKHYSQQQKFFQVEGHPGSIECCTDEFFLDNLQNLKKIHNINLLYLL